MSSASQARLGVRDLGARYGRMQVCFDISFDLHPKELLVVLGANGAGKTSLLGALAGCVASDGAVSLGTHRLAGLGAGARSALGLVLVPEGRRNLFDALSVSDNLRLGLRLLTSAKDRETMRDSLLDMFPILRKRLAQPAGMLSGGEQQMLAIALALARKPEVVLLDEPSQGLAPIVLDQLVETIGRLREWGLSVVLAEQNHAFAARLADRFVILRGGRIAAEGSRAELADRERAAAAMFGAG